MMQLLQLIYHHLSPRQLVTKYENEFHHNDIENLQNEILKPKFINENNKQFNNNYNNINDNIDCSVLEIDQNEMTATCGSGVTMGELERACLTHGLFPKVVPGTEFVTIGGAVASNIHGKAHQRFGSFGDQLLEIALMDAVGRLHILKPEGSSRDLFWATIGGMGLTGAIMSAKISLMKVETAFVLIS
jgi:FAD/FMN-containing dehydrogenase